MTTALTPSAPPPGGGRHRSFVEILLAAILRGVTAFFRQSSLHQARHNRGSQRVQEENIDYLHHFNVDPDAVYVIRAYGESGDAGQTRRRFLELEDRIRRGLVGLVVLARHDRLGRNELDTARILDAMREHGVLIMVNGHIYDPADEGDDMLLTMHAKFAQLENRARARWMSAARFANAKRLEARQGLPQGLVWADPTDDAYLARARDAGLEAWAAGAAAHRVKSPAGDQVLRILPFPDADVVRSCELRVVWMLETGDLAEVVRRIETHPDWPRPGLVPTIVRPVRGEAPQRQVSRYAPDLEPLWEPVTSAAVRRWLSSHAVYGVYRYRAPGLASAPVKAQLRLLARVQRKPGAGQGALPQAALPQAALPPGAPPAPNPVEGH